MDPEKLRDLLQSVRQGTVDIETAMEKLKTLPYEDLGDFARLDLHRGLRNAMPEVVFCESKTSEQATVEVQTGKVPQVLVWECFQLLHRGLDVHRALADTL